jgi:hypothetical protein
VTPSPFTSRAASLMKLSHNEAVSLASAKGHWPRKELVRKGLGSDACTSRNGPWRAHRHDVETRAVSMAVRPWLH